MDILIFILVIVALIVVHEFGHMIAAKLSGMRIDEFGIGYPPRALTLGKIGETRFTLNWIPFGGFVRIFGESLSDQAPSDPRAFSARPRPLQAFVLVAGVAMNLLFAYALIAGALAIGTPHALAPEEIPQASDVELAVAGVLPESPAAEAGLKLGDSIVRATGAASTWQDVTPESFTAFVSEHRGEPITFIVRRAGSEHEVIAVPKQGIAINDPERYALGVNVGTIGVISMPVGSALLEGAKLTWSAIEATAVGLVQFFYNLLTLRADFSQVAGPVGIAGAVGSASSYGLGNLFSLMAIISINLALINLIPIPALDGGRLLFVLIESVIRRPIATSVANAVNGVGFALLILLMVVVTVHDIVRLV